MKLALISNRGGRITLSEVYQRALENYRNLNISQFNLEEIQKIKEEFDFYLRLGDDNYEGVPSNLHPIGWWVNDTHLKKCYKKIKKMIKNYDFVFCAQKEGGEKLHRETGKKAYWIPWASVEVSPDFRLTSEKEKVWDIVFIGTTGKYSLRKVVLEKIKISYPNSFIGRANYWELWDYYSKARITVNYSINNDINPRIFEAMGAGALVITHRIKNNGFEDIFEENKHLVIFDDILREMEEKINYYLKNIKERERIAREGLEYVRNNHTHRHRAIKMLEIMGHKLE